jgi:hypothetical protein
MTLGSLISFYYCSTDLLISYRSLTSYWLSLFGFSRACVLQPFVLALTLLILLVIVYYSDYSLLLGLALILGLSYYYWAYVLCIPLTLAFNWFTSLLLSYLAWPGPDSAVLAFYYFYS